MLTHDLRFEDTYLDPDRVRASDGDLVAVSGWGRGEDIRPGDCLLIGEEGPSLSYEIVRITSRFARGLFFWTAVCCPSNGSQSSASKGRPLRLVTP